MTGLVGTNRGLAHFCADKKKEPQQEINLGSTERAAKIKRRNAAGGVASFERI
jgi:hypothetical protein